MGCNCNLSQSKKDSLQYLKISKSLPLIRGSIIRPDGTVLDVADIIKVPKSPIDPQLAKSQNIFPYIRDTVILEDGQTCSLTDIIEYFLEEFNRAAVLDEKWTSYTQILSDIVLELQEYVRKVEQDANVVYTSELRLDSYLPQEGDWINGYQT